MPSPYSYLTIFLFKNFAVQLLESEQSSNVCLMSTSPNKRNKRPP